MFYSNSHLRLIQKMLLIKCKEMQMPRGNVIGFGLGVFWFFLVGLSCSSRFESDFCFT